MPKSKAKKSVKKTPAPYAAEDKADPMFPSTKRNARIGGGIRTKKDLSRFVRWPRNVRIQRQRKLLMTRLKVPPSINQFSRSLSKDQARTLFTLLSKYKPETKKEKQTRLLKTAQDKEAGKEVAPYKKPLCVQYGLSHVIHLIERKAAKLVAIASDVDPIELVVYLPALCQKMGVPYCIVKNKSRLGKLVDKKNATCVCLTGVEAGDQKKLQQVAETCMTMFNDNTQANRQWGGGNMGLKTTKRLEIRARMLAAEQAKKAKY